MSQKVLWPRIISMMLVGLGKLGASAELMCFRASVLKFVPPNRINREGVRKQQG